MLELLGYLVILLAGVPVFGLLVTGSIRGAWRYSAAWARVMGLTVVAAWLAFMLLRH